jgi:DNA-binding transcriptional MerR regulator
VTRKASDMLKIGEFARLSQVSMKTLRHYDRLGLLQPSAVDPENGYRLYRLEQLVDMMRIQALKDCGFSLEAIVPLLQSHDADHITALLHERVAAQQQVIADEQARLQRLIGRIELLSANEPAPKYDVAVKRTEPLTLVGLRRRLASASDIEPLVWTVVRYFEQHGLVLVGSMVHLYHDVTTYPENIEVFVGAPVMALPAAIGELVIERLAGGEQVACVLHRGDYSDITRPYLALNQWLVSTGYQLSGARREIYHRSPLHTPDSAAYLTEIQYPIAAPLAKHVSPT